MTEVLDMAQGMVMDAAASSVAVSILLRVTVLLLAAILVVSALRRSSAAARHLVWMLSLAGALLIPPLCWAFPAWQLAVLPARQESAEFSKAPLRNVHSPQSPMGLPFPIAVPPVATASVSSVEPSELAVRRTSPNETSSEDSLTHRSWSWPGVLAAVWTLGTLLGVIWIGIGLVAAWHVTRRAEQAPNSDWREILSQLLRSSGIRRPVELRQCLHVSVPMTWGLRRPVILVPASSASWSETTKRSVLLHELGHVRRGDSAIHMLGRLACAAYWFHPLMWLGVRQLRKTSERAADDVVLSANIAPPDYAQHLVAIAAQLRGRSLLGHVALPMASPSDLAGRVRAILDPRREHRSLKRRTCYALILLATVLVIPCALLRLEFAEAKPPTSPAETADGAHVLAGQIVAPDGKPVKGATVPFDYGGFAPRYSAKTDSGGFYHVVSRSMPPKFVRVEARGYASMRQEIERGRNPVLRLEEARILRGRIVDVHGTPVSGATVVVSRGTAHPNAPFFRTVTDRQGRFVWRNAPSRPLAFSLSARGDWMIKNETLQASGNEHTITLLPRMCVHGTVVDEGTGKPIHDFHFFFGSRPGGIAYPPRDEGTGEPVHDDFHFLFGSQAGEDNAIVYQPWDGCITDNTFRVMNNQPFEGKEYFRIEAEGYETITKEFEHGPGKQRFDIKLRKAEQPSNEVPVSATGDHPVSTIVEETGPPSRSVASNEPVDEHFSDADLPTAITDMREVTAKLTEIRDVSRRHEKQFENLHVQGRLTPNDLTGDNADN